MLYGQVPQQLRVPLLLFLLAYRAGNSNLETSTRTARSFRKLTIYRSVDATLEDSTKKGGLLATRARSIGQVAKNGKVSLGSHEPVPVRFFFFLFLPHKPNKPHITQWETEKYKLW